MPSWVQRSCGFSWRACNPDQPIEAAAVAAFSAPCWGGVLCSLVPLAPRIPWPFFDWHGLGSAKSDAPNVTGETPLLCAAKQGHVEATIRHRVNAQAWRWHSDTRNKEDIHESSLYVYFVLLFLTASYRQVAAPETVLTLCLLPWHRHLHPLSDYRHVLLSLNTSGSEASSEQPGECKMEQIGLFPYLTGHWLHPFLCQAQCIDTADRDGKHLSELPPNFVTLCQYLSTFELLTRSDLAGLTAHWKSLWIQMQPTSSPS